MKSNAKRIFSILILTVAAVIWGLAFVAQDMVGAVPPFALGFGRSVLATVFLAAAIPIFDRVKKSDRRLISSHGVGLNRFEVIGGVLAGVFLALASALQQMGINQGTDSGKAAFITALYVVIVPIYALVLKKRAPINVYLGIAIATVGFYLLCIDVGSGFSILPSDLLVVGCALLFPIQILAIDVFSPKSDGARMSLVQFATASVVNAIFALILEGGIDVSSLISHALPVVYLGIGSSGVAYTLQIIGQRGVDPSAASVLLSLESVFGALFTALIIGTYLSPVEYLGCAIILAAVILAQVDFKKKVGKEYAVTEQTG